MAINQHAFQQNIASPQRFDFTPEPSCIDLEHVSVSQLLGRDYIFINALGCKLPLTNPTLSYRLLSDLVRQLDLAETHIVAVSVEELTTGDIAFVRHDLAWYKHQICRIESVAITHPEQYEFMDMIWRCSTTVALA